MLVVLLFCIAAVVASPAQTFTTLLGARPSHQREFLRDYVFGRGSRLWRGL
jgi:hypothetical protein